MTVATVAFGLGLLLLAGAGFFVLIVFADLRALRTLRRLHPAPVGTRGRVALEAVTEYGNAGRQIAPVTGEECIWYRVTLVREHATDPEIGADVILETESPSWPAVADRDHRIPVDPRLLIRPGALAHRIVAGSPIHARTQLLHTRAEPVPLPPFVPADVIGRLRKSELLRLTEIRIPRGVPVFAVGRVTGDGLLPSRTGLTVFTTDSRPDVIAARRADVRTGLTMIRWCTTIGLVLAVAALVYLFSLPR